MRILLTGAAGFLGGATWAELEREFPSVEVIAVSRLGAESRGILACDLAEREQVRRLPRVDSIVHLAAYVPPIEACAEAERSMRDNVRSTLNVLEFASDNEIRSVILGSSCAVYGAQTGNVPIPETATPRPMNFYAHSKLAAETIGLPFQFVRGISVKSLRFSYLYGSGMRESTVVKVFDGQARRGEALRVFNGGADFFDLLHVRDAARAVSAALRREGSGIFNIGSGTATTTKELAEAVVGAAGSRSRIEVLPASAPAKGIRLDVKQAGRHLGWRPSSDLARGLRELG